MFDLNATLGLQNVEADPNTIPDGRYDGKITKSEYVLTKAGKVAHVTTFTVTDGQYKGAQRQKWDNLGENAKDANGNPAEKIDEVVAFDPLMSDNNKTWYKKFWADLGIDTDTVQAKPEMLVGKLVTFGVKRNQGYPNINFVELRTEGTVTEMGGSIAAPVSLDATPNPFAGSEGGLPSF